MSQYSIILQYHFTLLIYLAVMVPVILFIKEKILNQPNKVAMG